jgi:transposase
MQRGKFLRQFKLEAARHVREGGVSIAQAVRNLDVHENVLRRRSREFGSCPRKPSLPWPDEARAVGDRPAAA